MSNIDNLLATKYNNISIEKENKDNIKKFVKLYKNKLKGDNNTLKDMKKTFNQITPKNIRKSSLEKIANLSLNKKDFLKIVTHSLISIMLSEIIKCQRTLYNTDKSIIKDNKERIILYNSCTIWAISNNKELSKLAKILGINIPQIPSNYEIISEKRSVSQLRLILKGYNYKGIDNFSKKMLMFLLPDEDRSNIEYDTLMSRYKNSEYGFKDIVNWNDLDIEKNKKFMISLFPNPNIISDNNKKIFLENLSLRYSIIYIVLRIILFFGFNVDRNLNINIIKPLFRVEEDVIIGICSKNTFKLVKSIIKFLLFIRMEYLSNLMLLVICESIKADNKLYKKFNKNNKLDRLLKLNENFKQYTYGNNIQLYGLNYKDNSCYIDSTLMALLGPRNSIIKEKIVYKDLQTIKYEKIRWALCAKDKDKDIELRENIQKSIKDIDDKIRGKNNNIETCSNLRRQIKKCPGVHTFHGTDTQDAGEFFTYLMNLFQIDITKSVRKTYGRNKAKDKWKLQSKFEDKNTSPIINIESTSLLNIKSDYDISNFIIQKQYTTFDDKNKWYPKKKENSKLSFVYKKEIFKVTESPIVIFNLLRTYGEPIYSKNNEFINIKERNIWKNIKAPESFILNKTKLNLVSIVVHTGGAHYVCNFKFIDNWYWYDDSPSKSSNTIKRIGKYSDMINTDPSPLNHGTIFIYVKDNKEI